MATLPLRYCALRAESDVLGHRNDCAVIAIAAVTDSSYEDALAAMQLAMPGYDPKQADPWPITSGLAAWAAIRRAIGILDYATIPCDMPANTIRQAEKEALPGARYLIETRGHAIGLVDGIAQDHSHKHGRRRIRCIWKVVKQETE